MLEIGQSAVATRAYTAGDVAEYVALGGARPPEGTVPEPLVGALFSYLLGVQMPGLGTKYLKQECEYLEPARLDDVLTARVEIVRLRPEKHLADLTTTCHGSDGTLICTGRSLVHIGDVER